MVVVVATSFSLVSAAAPPTAASSNANNSANSTAGGELFKKSVEAYRAGQFAVAVDLLNQAYALDPQPVLLYNLARAYEGLGDNSKAVTTYEKYLREDPKAKDRGAIEQRVETLKREIAEKAALAQQRDAERQRAEELRREREREGKPTDAESTPQRRSVLPYVMMGVGLAGVATGGVVGLMANSKHSEAESARSQESAIATQDDAKSQATISTIAFIAGGALIAGGAVWWILDTPKKSSSPPRSTPASGSAVSSMRIGAGPSFVVLRGAF